MSETKPTPKQNGLGAVGVILFIILSFIISPFGALILAYFLFKGKEERKWKTSVAIFWWIIIPSMALIFLALIATTFLPYLFEVQ